MSSDLERAQKRYQREKAARLQAEEILELKSRELFEKNQDLKKLSESLESQVVSRTKDLMAARDEALSAARAKSEFLANMSHELRTPMNGVLGMLAMLQSTQLDEQQAEFLQVSKSSGELLLSVINDILDFSKIDAGRMDLEHLVFEPSNLLTDVVTPLNFMAEEKGIQLTVDCDKHMPAAIWGDPTRLKQIIINLVSNAVKFTAKGSVSVSVKAVNDEYMIQVKDTGMGMDKNQLQHIFDAFGQGDSSITRTHGGTGLGLTITNSLVQMMKGRVKVESELNKGSIFSVNLPLLHASKEALQSIHEMKQGLVFSQEPILLVEDNLVNQRIAKHLLDEANLNVSIANNGLEALELLNTKRFNLVLMDLQMPVMDGIEATRKIRRSETAFKHIPIIAMTAHASTEHIQECLEVGMNAHTTKPIDVDVLLNAIANWITPSGVSEPKEQQTLSSNDSLMIDGIEVRDGIKRVNGNLALFKKLLLTFCEESEGFAGDINALMQAGETIRIKNRFHGVKGSASNISAFRVSELAAVLEKESAQGNIEFIQSNISEFIDELSSLCGNIRQTLESDDSKEESYEAMSEHEWQQGLLVIVENVNTDFSVASDEIERISNFELPQNKRDLIKSLARYSNEFDMTEIESTIKQSQWWNNGR